VDCNWRRGECTVAHTLVLRHDRISGLLLAYRTWPLVLPLFQYKFTFWTTQGWLAYMHDDVLNANFTAPALARSLLPWQPTNEHTPAVTGHDSLFGQAQ
jgi:hypothetical protein